MLISAAEPRPYKRTSLMDRLMRKVEMIPESGCWIFTGSYCGMGYGVIGTGNGARQERTHRVSYTLFRGPIQFGMLVCHRCDVPACCNPHHLFLGTQDDNMQDMRKKGRQRGNPAAYPGTGKSLHTKVFSQAEVTQMRALRVCGVPIKELATQFDVQPLVIAQIVGRHPPSMSVLSGEGRP